MRRVLLTLGIAAGILVLGVGLGLAGAFLGDRVTSQHDEQVQPPIRNPVYVTGPAANDPRHPDPGAVVGLGKPPAPFVGVAKGAWVLPTDAIAESGHNPRGAGAGGVSVPVDKVGATAKSMGDTQLAPPGSPDHFVDQCAEGATPCPAGEPGTVVPLAGSLPPKMPSIRLWPGLTKTTYPGLRCDPGFRTSQRIPVVVTSDTFLSSLTVTLSIPKVSDLDTVELRSAQAALAPEEQWFTKRNEAGLPMGTDLDNGVQYCASLRTEHHPDLSYKLTGITLPAKPTYRVTATGYDIVLNKVTATADYATPVPHGRPPVLLTPLSGNVLQVVVPETDPSLKSPSAPQPKVWAERPWGYPVPAWDGDCSTFAPVAGKSGAPLVGYPRAPAKPYDPAELAKANYPYDRAYTHFSVWNIVLQESNAYFLCVSWPSLPSGEEYQAFRIETPDSMRLRISAYGFQGETRAYYMLRTKDAVCPDWQATWGPKETSPSGMGWAWPEIVCDSKGFPFPLTTTFEMMTPTYKGGELVDSGSQALFTPTWCQAQPGESFYPAGVIMPAESCGVIPPNHNLIDVAPNGSGGFPIVWEVPRIDFWWREHVLCGGPGPCVGPDFAWAGTTFYWYDVPPFTERRDPLDWRIQAA